MHLSIQFKTSVLALGYKSNFYLGIRLIKRSEGLQENNEVLNSGTTNYWIQELFSYLMFIGPCIIVIADEQPTTKRQNTPHQSHTTKHHKFILNEGITMCLQFNYRYTVYVGTMFFYY